MIESLEQLTIGRFVDLLCGDMTVITEGDMMDPLKVEKTARLLVLEYKEISDAGSFRRYLSDTEETAKAKMALQLFTICQFLIGSKRYDKVREILVSSGVRAQSMSETRLSAEVKSRIERAKSNLAKLSEDVADDKHDIEDIRREFDSMTAAMMAHFKFQIDMGTMKATLYAHLYARLVREIKAQKESMKQYR